MSEVVGSAGVTIEPEGFAQFGTTVEQGVLTALQAVENQLAGIEDRFGGIVGLAKTLGSELESLDASALEDLELKVDTGDLQQQIVQAIEQVENAVLDVGFDQANLQSDVQDSLSAISGSIVVTADASQVTGDVDGAIDAADTDVTITGDAAELTGDVDGAIDAADTDVIITGDASEITGDINGAIAAAQTSIQVSLDPASLAGIESSVTAATAGLGRGLGQSDDAAQGLLGSLGSLKGAAAGLGLAVGATELVGFFQDSISASSDLEESLSKTQAVFGEASSAVEGFADDAATSVGLTSAAALEGASTFGNLFTSFGIAQDQSAELSTEIVTLGSDLASFNNLAGGTDEALQILRSGLTGEIEPLKRIGASFTAVEVSQRAVTLGLAEQGEELDEASKIQARYSLILERTGNAQGDFERTSGGLANQLRILQSEFGDVLASVGSALLPVVLELVDSFRSLLPVVEIAGRILGTVFQAVAPILNEIISALTPVIEQIGGALLGAVEGLLPVFEALGTLIGDTFAILLPAIDPLIPILDLVGGLIGTIALSAVDLIEALSPIIALAAQIIATGLDLFLTALLAILDPLISLFGEGLPLAIGAVADVIEILLTPLTAMIDALAGVGETLDTLTFGLSGSISGLAGAASGSSELNAKAQELALTEGELASATNAVTTAFFQNETTAAGLTEAYSNLDGSFSAFLTDASVFADLDLLGPLANAGIPLDELRGLLEGGTQNINEFAAALIDAGELELAIDPDLGAFDSDRLRDADVQLQQLLNSGQAQLGQGGELIQAFIDQAGAVDRSARSTLEAAELLGEFSQGQIDAATTIAAGNDGLVTQAEILRVLSTDIDAVNTALAETTGVAAEVAPSNQEIAESLLDVAEAALTTGTSGEELAALSEELGLSLEDLTGFTEAAEEAFDDFADSLTDSVPELGSVVDAAVSEFETAEEAFLQATEDAGEAAEDLADITAETTGEIAAAYEDLDDVIRDSALSIADAERDAAEAVQEASESIVEAQDAAASAVEDAQRRVEDALRAQARSLEDSQEKVEDANQKLLRTEEDTGRDIQEARDALNAAIRTGTDLDEVETARKRLEEIELKAARSIADARDGVSDAERDSARATEDSERKVEDALASQVEAQENATAKIIAAQEAQATATIEAQESIVEAQNAATESLIAATEAVAEAEEDAAERIAEARDVVDEAIAATAEGSGNVAESLIQSLQDQEEALTEFQSNVQILLAFGFDDIAQLAIQRGPEFTAELASALQNGDPALADALEGQLESFEGATDDVESFLRDDAAPQLVDVAAFVAEELSERFGVDVQFVDAVTQELDDTTIAFRALSGDVAAAAELVARDLDTSFLENVNFSGTTLEEIRAAGDVIAVERPNLEAEAETAAASASTEFGEGLGLGLETLGGLSEAEQALTDAGLTGSEINSRALTAGQAVGSNFAFGISIGLNLSRREGALNRGITRFVEEMIDQMIEEASASPPMFAVGEAYADGLGMGFADGMTGAEQEVATAVGSLVESVTAEAAGLTDGVDEAINSGFSDLGDQSIDPFRVNLERSPTATVDSLLEATGGELGPVTGTATVPGGSSGTPESGGGNTFVTVDMVNQFEKDPDPRQIGLQLATVLEGI